MSTHFMDMIRSGVGAYNRAANYCAYHLETVTSRPLSGHCLDRHLACHAHIPQIGPPDATLKPSPPCPYPSERLPFSPQLRQTLYLSCPYLLDRTLPDATVKHVGTPLHVPASCTQQVRIWCVECSIDMYGVNTHQTIQSG